MLSVLKSCFVSLWLLISFILKSTRYSVAHVSTDNLHSAFVNTASRKQINWLGANFLCFYQHPFRLNTVSNVMSGLHSLTARKPESNAAPDKKKQVRSENQFSWYYYTQEQRLTEADYCSFMNNHHFFQHLACLKRKRGRGPCFLLTDFYWMAVASWLCTWLDQQYSRFSWKCSCQCNYVDYHVV